MIRHAALFWAQDSDSGSDPALMTTPAPVRDHVLGVLTQCAWLKVCKVADEGQVRVASPEELPRLIRIGGPAGRVVQKLVYDRAP